MAAVSTIIAGAALAYGVYSGEEQRAAAKTGRREQRQAQQQAESAALAEARVAEQERAKANAKTPDIPSILSATSRPKGTSLYAGPLGADQSLLQLGKPKLLGE